MKNGLIKTLSAAVAISIIASLMSGCGKSGSSTASSTPAGGNANSAPVTIDYLAYNSFAQPDPESPVVKKVEEKLNAKFNFWYVDSSKYDDVLNVKLASGDMPDVMNARTGANLSRYVNQGILAPIEYDTVKKFAPEYTKYIDTNYKQAWSFGVVNNKIYAIPLNTLSSNYPTVVIWNKTWLNNVGINKIPSTLAEFEDALYKFRNNDPDKNGKKDTYGLSDFGMPGIMGAFGYPAFYAIDSAVKNNSGITTYVKDGKIIIGALEPEMKDALTLLQKWYKDGIIDPEFITSEHTTGHWAESQAFENGRIGLTGMGYNSHYRNELDPSNPSDTGGGEYVSFKKMQPNSEYAYGTPAIGPSGKSGTPQGSKAGAGMVLTTKGVKNPRILETMLKNIELNATDYNYFLLTNFGIEGTDYTLANGVPASKHTDWKPTDSTKYGLGVFANVSVDSYLKKANDSIYKFADKTGSFPGYENINLPSTDTYTKYNSSLSKIIVDTYVKIITGQQSPDTFDDMVKKVKASGGDELLKTLNEQYASMQKK